MKKNRGMVERGKAQGFCVVLMSLSASLSRGGFRWESRLDFPAANVDSGGRDEESKKDGDSLTLELILRLRVLCQWHSAPPPTGSCSGLMIPTQGHWQPHQARSIGI